MRVHMGFQRIPGLGAHTRGAQGFNLRLKTENLEGKSLKLAVPNNNRILAAPIPKIETR